MSFPAQLTPKKPSGRPAVQAGPAFPKTPLEWPNYLNATAQEWGRISWPSQLQVMGLTAIVVVIVTTMTLALWGMDNLLRFIIQLITPH
jgi:preprotein translocase SecE subunit